VARHGKAVVLALVARGVPLDRAKDLSQAAWLRLWARQRAGVETKQMSSALEPAALADVWSQFESRFGLYERIVQCEDHGLFADVVARFGHTDATFEVAVDFYGRVAGWHLVNIGEPVHSSPGNEKSNPQLDFGRQSG